MAWDQRDNSGQPVTYGHYFVQLGAFHAGDAEFAPVFGVLPFSPMLPFSGMRIPVLILPLAGAIEKTIEVNRSVTADWIIITLQRVEMTDRGLTATAFNIPPGYSFPAGQPLPPPQFMITAEAEYSVDGAAFRKAGPSGLRPQADGLLFVWENLDPVPKNARELTFRITKLGDWSGPWEFRVPLK
ncbi:MAG: hypothetical protein HYX84_03555 [Chloroflexi bacterium]|nr:hypothetical protein [Chloroflexota bacterium]